MLPNRVPFTVQSATRHISRRELIVREREIEGTLGVCKIDTSDNIADILTKVLDRDPYSLYPPLTPAFESS